jgi:hypothetical protein
MDEGQVAVSHRSGRRRTPKRESNPSPISTEDSVASFFKQLWSVPRPNLARVRSLFPNLQWIKRDLSDPKQLGVQNLGSVQEPHLLHSDLGSKGGAQGLGKQGEHRSFLQVLTGDIAGRGGRGRGRGRGDRFEEEQWGGPLNWWNQGFQPFPHPQFHPPPYGFFPNQQQFHLHPLAGQMQHQFPPLPPPQHHPHGNYH